MSSAKILFNIDCLTDKIQDNLLEFLQTQNVPFVIQFEGRNIFQNSKLAVICEKVVKQGGGNHLFAFSFDLNNITGLDKIFEQFNSSIAYYEINIELPVHKSFYKNLEICRKKFGFSCRNTQFYCTLSEKNYHAVKKLYKYLENSGFNLNIEREMNSEGWVEYPPKIERWLKSGHWLQAEQKIDIPLNMVKNGQFKQLNTVCSCGNKFFRVMSDGTVKRCFTKQISGWEDLGDFSKTSDVRLLKENSPCFSVCAQCKHYAKLKVQNFIFDKADVLVDDRNKKYDVAVVGFGWAANYGSILTNYGFISFLKKMGLKPLMVEKPRDFVNNCYPDEVYSQTFSRKFNEKYFKGNLSRIYNDKNDMKALNSICDTFILGSDQCLRYDLQQPAQYYAGMDFLNADKKKIAFSSGLGHFEYLGDDWYKMNMHYYLAQFDHVAVREPSTKFVVKEQFNTDAVNVVDPMYLIDKEEYEYLASQSDEPLEKDCIVAFILAPDKKYKEQLDLLSKKLSGKVIVLAECWNVDILKSYGFENVIAPSVESWINHLLHAKYVVTDSFHAVYTLITLRKQFTLVVNKNIAFKRGMARFPMFSRVPELAERIVYSIDDIGQNDKIEDEIDFKPIVEHFDNIKEFSVKWLKEALAAPKTKPAITDSESLSILHDKLNYLKDYMDDINKAIRANNTCGSANSAKSCGLKKLLRKIFSVEKIFHSGKKYKVITVLGVKLKLRRH